MSDRLDPDECEALVRNEMWYTQLFSQNETIINNMVSQYGDDVEVREQIIHSGKTIPDLFP